LIFELPVVGLINILSELNPRGDAVYDGKAIAKNALVYNDVTSLVSKTETVTSFTIVVNEVVDINAGEVRGGKSIDIESGL
jgi:hypothetical protein